MRQKASIQNKKQVFKIDFEVQCNLEGSAIAAAGQPESGLTQFLKDRYEQLKIENEDLQATLKAQKGQGLHNIELSRCIRELKTATIKQFINKQHVELDVDPSERVSSDIAYLIDVVQTVTQIIKQKVEVSAPSKSELDKLGQKVTQMKSEYASLAHGQSVLMALPPDAKIEIDRRSTLFLKVAALLNKSLAETNLTKVKAAVLKHDSKLCRQNVLQLQQAIQKEDPMKQLVQINQQ